MTHNVLHALDAIIEDTTSPARGGQSAAAGAVLAVQHTLTGVEPSDLTITVIIDLVTRVLRTGNPTLAAFVLAWLQRHHTTITAAINHDRPHHERRDIRQQIGTPLDPQRSWILPVPPLWHGVPCPEAAALWSFCAWSHALPHAEMIVTSILQRSTNPQRRIADEDIPHLLSMLHCVAICAPLWDAPWPADKPSEHPRAIYDLLDTKHPSLWVEHPMVDRLALMLTPQEAAELWEKAAAHNGADLAIAAVLFLRRYQHPNVLLHGLRTHGVPVLCTPRLSAHAALAIVADLPSAQDIEQRTKADPSGVAHSVLYAEIGTILDTHTDFRAKLAAQAMAHRLWIEKEHKARMLEVQKAMIQKKHEDEARMKAAAAQRHINRIARD